MTQMAQMSAWHATLGGDAMDAYARRLALSHLPTAHCHCHCLLRPELLDVSQDHPPLLHHLFLRKDGLAL
jgi:hypothetical protein